MAVKKSHAIVEERPIDGKRPMRVICVGAGISGILTAIRFPQRIPNLELQIYEKNPDISGTWFENRYPGCACGKINCSVKVFESHKLKGNRYPGSYIPTDV
jgi:hypothetical protein